MSNPAIPAATLITVRERSGASPELLMVERAQGMAFAGGAMVFPGGRIDAADHAFADRLGLGTHGGAIVAAIRETLEETAIPVALLPAPDPDRAHAIQQALIADQEFAAVLAGHGLSLDPAALHLFARWVPKFHAARRFDTLFFLARAPEGDREPSVIEGECASAEWLTAEQVLERDRAGGTRLIFPTRRNLERLAQHASFDAMIADAATFPVDPITPWLEERDGERFVTIPQDIGYPVTAEKLDGLWRG